MNINQSIITLMILATVSSITIGCASKVTEEQVLELTEEQALELTEEQALAESQALSDGIKNHFSRSSNIPGIPNLPKIDLPATKRIGNKNQRLVLLSHRASLRWLGEAGFKFHKNDHGISTYLRRRNVTGRGFRSRGGDWGDDPQYIYFNNLPVMIIGVGGFRDPQAGEEILYIFDQYDDVRVITYERY